MLRCDFRHSYSEAVDLRQLTDPDAFEKLVQRALTFAAADGTHGLRDVHVVGRGPAGDGGVDAHGVLHNEPTVFQIYCPDPAATGSPRGRILGKLRQTIEVLRSDRSRALWPHLAQVRRLVLAIPLDADAQLQWSIFQIAEDAGMYIECWGSTKLLALLAGRFYEIHDLLPPALLRSAGAVLLLAEAKNRRDDGRWSDALTLCSDARREAVAVGDRGTAARTEILRASMRSELREPLEFDAALQALDRLIADTGLDRGVRAEAALGRAQLLLMSGQAEEAEKQARAAGPGVRVLLEVDPKKIAD